MSEETLEREIQAKGLTAPRLTPDLINSKVKYIHFYIVPGTTLTVCCLTLNNGFNVVGTSAAISEDNFDKLIGERVAEENARRKIWELEGYLLKQKLYEEQ